MRFLLCLAKLRRNSQALPVSLLGLQGAREAAATAKAWRRRVRAAATRLQVHGPRLKSTIVEL